MQNKKTESGHQERSQPLGICQRLFNFLVTTMLPRGIRRLTTGMPRGNEADVLIEDPIPVAKNTNRVSFKDLETWTPINGMGSSILLPERANRGSEKEVPLMDSDGNYSDRQVQKRKEKRRNYNLAPTERLILPVDPDDDDSEIYGSRLRPLFSVESNINEKSSDFIQRRKEAMRRNIEP